MLALNPHAAIRPQDSEFGLTADPDNGRHIIEEACHAHAEPHG
jgi:hypothetical protein